MNIEFILSRTGLCVLYCLCVLTEIKSQQPCRQFETAMGNLREIVIGSCTIYQQNVNQPVFCPHDFRNCTDIWEAFSTAFKYQPKCNVSDERYTRFLQLTHHPITKDKAIFWENVYPFISRFSGGGIRYMALSDTLTGYIGNGPQWCSKVDEPGIEPSGTICPGWEATPDCPQSANRAFWVAASRYFGKNAEGHIYILLNTTYTPIFANDTYFAVYELPFLRETVVTKATVLLINEAPESGKTKCDDGSLDLLKTMIKEKSITYECLENRKDVVATYCLDYPGAPMCDNQISDARKAGNLLSYIVPFLSTLAVLYSR